MPSWLLDWTYVPLYRYVMLCQVCESHVVVASTKHVSIFSQQLTDLLLLFWQSTILYSLLVEFLEVCRNAQTSGTRQFLGVHSIFEMLSGLHQD